jgi:hypothetical protein
MKLEEWKTYRTRFLVQAKQLSTNLTFVDHLGRQHCGRKGDYLVESSDGVLSIAPRRIFEDIYVPMSAAEPGNGGTPTGETTIREPKLTQKFEPLEIEEVKLPRSPAARQRMTEAPALHNSLLRPEEEARVHGRKLPQPCRDRNGSPTRLGLM